MIGHVLHIVGWLLLLVVALATAGFLGMDIVDDDPDWTREKRVGLGIFLAGLLVVLILFTVKTYPF